MTNGGQIAQTTTFEQTLSAAAQLPGVRITRDDFLRTELNRFCLADQVDLAIRTTPAEAGIPINLLDQIAASVIKYETSKVTAISAAAGLPGGFAAFAAVPADVAQYFGHVLRVVQKLAYLYSWPDLFDPDGAGMDTATESMLTLFVGIMFGVNAAQAGVAKVSVLIAAEVTKKLPQKALTKGTIYPIVKKVAAAMSVKMTKQIFARGVSKAVPIVGAVVSGGLTLATFLPMSKRLQQHLRTLPLTHPNLGAQQKFGVPRAKPMSKSRSVLTTKTS
ncbi:MAG: hypothetical protein WBA05_09775 [Gordonia sp. (in: high G+C Gram-positive bacteria)]|uniref:hypothetical protein n=1 Tax=Gordonia TaxID=2053 RepID=UPI003267B67A